MRSHIFRNLEKHSNYLNLNIQVLNIRISSMQEEKPKERRNVIHKLDGSALRIPTACWCWCNLNELTFINLHALLCERIFNIITNTINKFCAKLGYVCDKNNFNLAYNKNGYTPRIDSTHILFIDANILTYSLRWRQAYVLRNHIEFT